MTIRTSAQPQPKASKEEILEFLAKEAPRYQRIELGYGLATKGSDRSEDADRILPKSLEGKSVLDIGCNLGFFSIEAWRRGATRVVGCEVNRYRLNSARRIAEILGAPVEYRRWDVERDPMEETFDYVLFLNVLHHLATPFNTLNRLIDLTREKLVIEIASLKDEKAVRRLADMGAGMWVRHKMSSLPVVLIGGSGITERKDEPFYFSPEALRVALLHQRRAFAKVEEDPSTWRSRHCMTFHRRRIDELLMIAGPKAIGRTTLRNFLQTDKAKALRAELGIANPEEWTSLSPKNLLSNKTPHISKAVFDYDTMRTFLKNDAPFYRDEALDVMGCAKRIVALAPVASLKALIDRIQGKIEEALQRGKKATHFKRMLAHYRRLGEVAERLEDWIGYCRSKGAEVRFVDVTGEPRLIAEEQWREVLGEVGD